MSETLCKHIGIIMDGNGRWAKTRGFPRLEGHRRGADNVRKVVEMAGNAGIKYITLYSFSTENWNRPKEEVDGLLSLLKRFLPKEAQALKKKNVRLEIIGDITRFSDDLQKCINDSVEITAECDGIVMVLALNYGGRDEIIRAVRQISAKGQEFTEENITKSLDTAHMPDLDVIVRTSGENRLSNFLLWQSAYAELIFVERTWPDFKQEDFDEVLSIFAQRERRFGGL